MAPLPAGKNDTGVVESKREERILQDISRVALNTAYRSQSRAATGFLLQ
jgi:hypothetical protein